MNKFVDGLRGVNKDYIGQYTNHIHICELRMLGDLYCSSKKDIQKYCPGKYKYKRMNSMEDMCDNCIHNRRIDLTDDGNHIINISQSLYEIFYFRIVKHIKDLKEQRALIEDKRTGKYKAYTRMIEYLENIIRPEVKNNGQDKNKTK